MCGKLTARERIDLLADPMDCGPWKRFCMGDPEWTMTAASDIVLLGGESDD